MRRIARHLGVVGGTVAALGLLGSPAAAQTTHQVDINSITFDPPTLDIDVGDTVDWVWVTGFHNVESGAAGIHNGIFRSGDPVSAPNTYSLTFDAAFLASNPVAGNSYDYFCFVHQAFGQEGTINVGAAGIPALPLWGLLTTIGGVVAGACLVLRKKRGGLPQA